MKAFKKLALVSAIAAAPFAQAELVSIDDAALSDMTGQAGVSIELSAKVDIGSIVYTDTGGLTNGDGTVSISNVVLGGSNATGAVVGALDEIKIDIDVDSNDGLVIHLGGTNAAGVLTGADKVDFGLSVGSVGVNNQAVLASNVFIGGNLGPIDVTIANDSSISVDAFFEVTEGSLNVDVLGVGVTNLTIGQDSSPFLLDTLSPYNNKATVEAGDFGVANNGVAVTAATNAIDQAGDGDGFISTAEWVASGADLNSDGTVTVLEADTALAAGTGAITSQAAAAAAPGVGGMAFVSMDIVTTNTSFIDQAGTPTAITNALDITIAAMSMDIAMDVSVGGVGIGNVAINDLNLSGTNLKIYGH